MMIDKHLVEEIRHVALSLFHKNFFSLYHGSISARINSNNFVINTKDTILDEINEDSLVRLDVNKRDYRWKLASPDVHIHEQIYENIPNAKYISYTMPPYATAFSLKHGKVLPTDFYGKTVLGEVIVYDPKNIDDWLDRAPFEIAHFFQKHDTHLLLIKGFGLISYDRDVIEMAKKISIVENSCRLIALGTML